MTWLLSVVKLSFIYFALVVPKRAEQILFKTLGKICVNLDIISFCTLSDAVGASKRLKK